MKTTIFLIIMIFTVNAYSQIKHTGSIETGWKQGTQTIHQNALFNARFTYPNNSFYTDVNLSFSWKCVNFEQKILNNFCYKQGKSLTPIDIEFISKLSLKYKSFSIGYEHSCLHPVISEKENLEQNWRRGNYDKLFFKFEW